MLRLSDMAAICRWRDLDVWAKLWPNGRVYLVELKHLWSLLSSVKRW